ncbi:hypothetical protein EDB86DRAFT_3090138 [Lactarius hatsudake]|nr:hypothetical protein EDB86DRAFT_3090138 [Lactarius hatsudake]
MPEASQLPPRVRRVILHVSQPSSDIPVAMPGLPLPPPPPPKDHLPPQTPSLPPLPPPPPPYLPPVAGPPNQISQYSLAGPATNIPPTYAHPYGAASYFPAFPPIPYHALHEANIDAAPFPPWGYPQYPLVPLPGPFVAHPPAAPSSTVSAEPSRQGLNKEVSDGEVVNDHIKNFREEVHRCFDRPRSEIHMMFRISRDGYAWSDLASKCDWADAIARLMGKVHSARTCVVSMEIKDKHGAAHAKVQSTKAKGKEKAKAKRHREDDIPPVLSPDMAQQLGCLVKLQQRLVCEKHSKPGKRVYCLVERSSESTNGGHEQLTHEEMSVWAKQMSLENTTEYTPPNIDQYDYPKTKRARTARATPEVHVSVNITPAVGTESSTLSAEAALQYITFLLAHILWATLLRLTYELIAARDSTSTASLEERPVEHLRVPTLTELLWLMDEYDPAIGMNYVDLEEEFTDLGITDSVILHSLPIPILASFGDLTHNLARRLHRFCFDLFIPLGLVDPMERNDTTEDDSLSQQETESAPRLLEEDEVIEVSDEVIEVSDEVIEVSDEETLVEKAESDADGGWYRATSYEV